MDNFLVLFNSLRSIQAISEIWKYVLDMLKNTYRADDDLLKLLCLFFALIDDGNLCIPLNPDSLKEKLNKKLVGLKTPDTPIDYDTIIKNGILAIENLPGDNPLIGNDNNMFVIRNGWLFTEKFFHAKCDIETAINKCFSMQLKSVAESDIQSICDKYNYSDKELTKEQATAIVRAKQGENLIITGGPGTGKTTVIFYLLLELLSNNIISSIYMTAPSGKAAERMHESIGESIKNLKDSEKQRNQAAVEKIKTIQPTTIHKLLGITAFNTHASKKIPANSVFIIDEASMIDAVLFAKLLNLITQVDGARVFILGDTDQLSPVQPGDVFSDLIKNFPTHVIQLIKTYRFPENSDIYKLKEYVRGQNDSFTIPEIWTENVPDNWKKELNAPQGEYPVRYISLSDEDKIRKATTEWYDAFYANCEYERAYDKLDSNDIEIENTLDKIWQHLIRAKILCAENHGIHGTKTINKTICEHIRARNHLIQNNNDKFFAGEQIIITQNQHFYNLSNGDIGVIISLDGKECIMIKRAKDEKSVRDTETGQLIRRIGSYIFYPLYLLPIDAIEPAYAITIHKSQGSEYDNILVFLPESENSQLLNRQILYTAITRTKHATYIISTKRNMEKAIKTLYERDTKLFL